MAKTAMQELKDKFMEAGCLAYWMDDAFDEAIKKGKQQIIDAYRAGFNSDDIKLSNDYYTQTYNNASEPVGEVDWVKLRDKFFKECTKVDSMDGCMVKIDISPHDLFEFFKSNIINK